MPPKKPQPLSTYDQGLLRSYLDNRDMLSLDDQAEARAILESRRLDVPSAGELARTIQAPASTIRPATTRERIHDAFADPVNAFRGFRDRTMANLPPEVQALTPDMTVAEHKYQKATTTPSPAIHPGNIDLIGRPEIPNKGGMSTVYSFSFLDEKPSSKTYGQEVLVPLADEGRIFTKDEARDKYYRTGKHLGTFETPEEATAYAGRLHDDYASGKYATRRSIIRPETGAERLRGNMRDVLGSIKKQPLVKTAAPFLGLDVDAPEGSDPVLKIGMMPDIGGKFTTGGRKLVGGLYSRLDEALDLIPKKGVHPNKARKILRDNSSAEERAYRGVDDFLETQGDRVTPEALAAHLEAHPAPFPKVKQLGGMGGLTEVDVNDALFSLEQLDTLNASQQARYDHLKSLAWDTPTKHGGGNLQVPGGENYRETLQKMPVNESAATAARDNRLRELLARRERLVSTRRRRSEPIVRPVDRTNDFPGLETQIRNTEAQIRMVERDVPSDPTAFTHPHFPGEPNILVHTRSNERTLPVPPPRRVDGPGLGTGDPAYVYHATNASNLEDIKSSGLNTHRAHEFTDQSTWPDGSQQKRAYFGAEPEHLWQFAPEEGTPVILRTKRTAAVKRESTGDLYKTSSTPASELEFLGDDNQWHNVTSTGERGRFIEEVQSDWHQAGKKRGYRSDRQPVALTDAETAELDGLMVNARQTAGFYNTPEGIRAAELLERREPNSVFGGVPDAPFKESWPELGLKRELIDAANDPSIDALAFTGGKTQADRYDLSKQISEVSYSGTNLAAFDLNGEQVISQAGVTRAELPGYIGKEAAERLLAQPRNGTLQTLSGVDLQVGGEGMEAFYDNLLPSRLGKIVKPMGGTVERSAVSGSPNPAWVTKLTPEIKAMIKKGLPLMAILAAMREAGIEPPPELQGTMGNILEQ